MLVVLLQVCLWRAVFSVVRVPGLVEGLGCPQQQAADVLGPYERKGDISVAKAPRKALL